MITIEDCLALSDLTEEEVDAIAEHEHLPEIIAAELGNYLAHLPGGVEQIRRMIRDDIAASWLRGDQRHAFKLSMVLVHFCHEHPEPRKGFRARGVPEGGAAP
jgi:hypothetical protein